MEGKGEREGLEGTGIKEGDFEAREWKGEGKKGGGRDGNKGRGGRGC